MMTPCLVEEDEDDDEEEEDEEEAANPAGKRAKGYTPSSDGLKSKEPMEAERDMPPPPPPI